MQSVTYTRVETTFDDLKALGYDKDKILPLCQNLRNKTIKDASGLHLNDDWAKKLGWHCYNVILTQPTLGASISSKQDSTSKLVAQYDNTNGGNYLQNTWKGGATDLEMVSLAITTPAVIRLDSPITIYNLVSSGYTVTVGSETTQPETTGVITQRQLTVDVQVSPGETVDVYLETEDVEDTGTYDVVYGLNTYGVIGTDGDMYKNRKEWAYNLNTLLTNPKGTLTLTGIRKTIVHKIRIESTGTGSTYRIQGLFARFDENGKVPKKA